MNNGVNNNINQNTVNNPNETNNNISNNNTLKPMEGVRIAPISSDPINASNKATSTSAYHASGPALNNPNNISNNNMNNKNNQISNNTAIETEKINEVPLIISNIPEVKENSNVIQKKKNNLIPIICLLLIIIMVLYIISSSNMHKKQIAQLKFNCTPINSSSEDKELNLNSTVVQDLYNKVLTSIREDYITVELNDEMKLYLAFRQIPVQEFYESNCNLFNSTKMEPYTCEMSSEFIPKAFKISTIEREIKKLYGEITSVPLKNIQLKNYCIGGYQYIPERGEYVEGLCKEIYSIPFKAEKKLVSAISNQNTITLKEEVVYKQGKDLSLPKHLKSGYYIYTFRLDMNYNYVLISKKYESKYK